MLGADGTQVAMPRRYGAQRRALHRTLPRSGSARKCVETQQVQLTSGTPARPLSRLPVVACAAVSAVDSARAFSAVQDHSVPFRSVFPVIPRVANDVNF